MVSIKTIRKYENLIAKDLIIYNQFLMFVHLRIVELSA